MRTLLAGVAAVWFIVQAFTFLPYGAYANAGAPGGIDGDLGAVAVTWAARALFAGLALLALALLNWDAIIHIDRTIRGTDS